MALPCEKTCTHYHIGCHKSCESWVEQQQNAARQRERIKAYLRDARELSLCLEQQHPRPTHHFYR